LLGRLNPERLTGVEESAPMETIAAAIHEQIGAPLGLDATAAAAAVLAVTTNQLAHAIRLVSVEKGHDPRDFALFAFGGAGPLHAVEIAREFGIPTVLVPRFPGITSGLGCVLAPVRHDLSRASVSRSPTRRPERSTDASPIRLRRDGGFSIKTECRSPKSWFAMKSICCSAVKAMCSGCR
jgi:N-methylhydantoinase A/oxoprolinase/acetone carboxylase beta subunit